MISYQWEIAARSKPSSAEDVLELLLQNRGFGLSFLNGSLSDLEPHLAIKGMDTGAVLMARHLAAGSKVIVISDFDCDGVTSAAQMVHFLRDIGYKNYEVVIPRRDEGYGVPERAVSGHPEARLFVAMDCGTHDIRSVSAARHSGSDFIVIDHHEASNDRMAPATVLINPKQPACPSAFKDFSASGLTLLFLAQLRRALNSSFTAPKLGGKYLCLAAIGTVTDLVPLVEANRTLTRSGLACINTGKYLPIVKLAENAGLSGKVLTAGHIGYSLGPRINAAGRMADPRLALDFLVSDQDQRAGELADELSRLNTKRQQQEEQILRHVRELYTAQEPGRRTLLMADSTWPHGVIGIIASRVQHEFHYGPAIILAIDTETGLARGSARSVPGFDIHAALHACQDLLLKWGGHRMAAGMTLRETDLVKLSDRLETIAATYPSETFVPRRRVDMEIELDLISPQLFRLMKSLEPHGVGNPIPTFGARGVEVSVQRAFGKDRGHLRLNLDRRIDAIFWQGGQRMPKDWQTGEPMDLVFQLEWDDYCGRPIAGIKEIGRVNTLWSHRQEG